MDAPPCTTHDSNLVNRTSILLCSVGGAQLRLLRHRAAILPRPARIRSTQRARPSRRTGNPKAADLCERFCLVIGDDIVHQHRAEAFLALRLVLCTSTAVRRRIPQAAWWQAVGMTCCALLACRAAADRWFTLHEQSHLTCRNIRRDAHGPSAGASAYAGARPFYLQSQRPGPHPAANPDKSHGSETFTPTAATASKRLFERF